MVVAAASRPWQRIEKLLVGFSLTELVEELFVSASSAHFRVFGQMADHPPEDIDALDDIRPQEKLFTPG
jgi:hypothetical protein